jgi:hypothetical protein
MLCEIAPQWWCPISGRHVKADQGCTSIVEVASCPPVLVLIGTKKGEQGRGKDRRLQEVWDTLIQFHQIGSNEGKDTRTGSHILITNMYPRTDCCLKELARIH